MSWKNFGKKWASFVLPDYSRDWTKLEIVQQQRIYIGNRPIAKAIGQAKKPNKNKAIVGKKKFTIKVKAYGIDISAPPFHYSALCWFLLYVCAWLALAFRICRVYLVAMLLISNITPHKVIMFSRSRWFNHPLSILMSFQCIYLKLISFCSYFVHSLNDSLRVSVLRSFHFCWVIYWLGEQSCCYHTGAIWLKRFTTVKLHNRPETHNLTLYKLIECVCVCVCILESCEVELIFKCKAKMLFDWPVRTKHQ